MPVPCALGMQGAVAGIAWQMGLQIKGIACILAGATRLRLHGEGTTCFVS
jgi:hypothetical protein